MDDRPLMADPPDDGETCSTGKDHRYELLYDDDVVRHFRCPDCDAEMYEDAATGLPFS